MIEPKSKGYRNRLLVVGGKTDSILIEKLTSNRTKEKLWDTKSTQFGKTKWLLIANLVII